MSVLCAGQSYCGSVHYWHQLLYVLHQHSIKEPLVSFLNPHEVNVSVKKEVKYKVNKTSYCVLIKNIYI